MEHIAKALRQFIARDVIYILGGSSIIFSIIYCWDLSLPEELSTAHYFLGGGFAYVIGYVIQEAFILAHVTTTVNHFNPSKLDKLLYRMFNRKRFIAVPEFDSDKVRVIIDEEGSDRTAARIERMVTLKHIGNTGSSCALVSFPFLLYRAKQADTNFELFFSFSVLFIGIMLVLLSRLRAVLQMVYMYRVYEKLGGNPQNGA